MGLQLRTILTFCLISGALLSACAGTSSVTSSADSDETFSKVLVIAIAGDYNVRSQLERVIVSNIRKTGASATAWYSAAGGKLVFSQRRAHVLSARHQ